MEAKIARSWRGEKCNGKKLKKGQYLRICCKEVLCPLADEVPVLIDVKFEAILSQPFQRLIVFGELAFPDFVTLILWHSKFLVHKFEHIGSDMMLIVVVLQRSTHQTSLIVLREESQHSWWGTP